MRLMKRLRRLGADLKAGKVKWLMLDGLSLNVTGDIQETLVRCMSHGTVFMTEDLWEIAEVDKELTASVGAMCDAGVHRLPFPQCVFLSPSGTMVQALLAMQEPEGGTIILVSALTDTRSGKWAVSPVMVKITYPYKLEPVLPDVRPWAEEYFNYPITEGGQTWLVRDWHHKQITGMVGVLNRMLVLLSTSGIEVRKVHTKTNLVNRDDPEYTYHELYIHGLSGNIGSGTKITERKRVRLHLRRGFERKNQPYGPGRRYRKRVWVRPALVGYQEEGQAFKTYRIRSEGGAGNNGQEKA